MVEKKKTFAEGKIWKIILSQAIPLMLAQLVQLLYNVVDRIFIGHMDKNDSTALTGVGLTFPIISFIIAFAALFGLGGVPLFSIANGAGKKDEAERILGNSFVLLIISSIILTAIGYIFCKPILYLLGASDSSYIYAADYLYVYFAGTIFVMLNTGLNGYIPAQGYPKIGMLTTIIGAIINLILDPIFIFVLNWGIKGAAFATVLSQIVSIIWILRFLTNSNTPLRLKKENIRFDSKISWDICKLGISNFIMQGTNCFVQAACNTTLEIYGGDIYVGIMTVMNSIRDIFWLPISGLVGGSQPVTGYNYGAKLYNRVKSAIKFNMFCGMTYTSIAWILIVVFPKIFFKMFSSDEALLGAGVPAIRTYFFGFIFMSFQFSGQSTFQALGKAKQAIFFSLLRKAIIVIPLTLILPRIGMGVNGVFIAEPISNAVGGLASFLTMYFTIYRKLGKTKENESEKEKEKEKEKESENESEKEKDVEIEINEEINNEIEDDDEKINDKEINKEMGNDKKIDDKKVDKEIEDDKKIDDKDIV
ncbi:MATE efflux family protein [Anaeromyces robustus]|uniref:MATE efflux family protein n=1 Tax=Anaeromyces robustus TaxID=1754192 RepID=A0A1Y1XJT6_9FUNG|nr:MATE efflux family protein [Anaeromyces robustus]|eukprot:ORX85982.1 MATE efflux family protein [Anaeromyces robustus]